MDPNDILALVAGGGGGLIVLGAGAWAYIRSRGKKSSDQQDAPPEQGDQGTTGTSTAVKERPAAPTWADTLSAPAPPKQTEPDQAEEPAAAPTDTSTAQFTDPADGDAPTDKAPVDAAPVAEVPADAVPVDEAPDDEAAPADASAEPAPSTEPAAPTEPAASAETAPAGAVIETPEAPADRMVRLRERLSRSGSIGRGILNLLTRGTVDEETWDEIEETLLLADLGPDATDELLESLRRRIQVLGTDDP
ncbi:MAG TPA: signal recognition particle receptor subunit alpha, partial [Candidatus Brachybacterium merdigallinarum]|nr:signal recognition particle receptor subunit alpha [Candidatus Brachybacterium merdigallinarum]